MEIKLFADAIEDLNYWQKSGNRSVQKKISKLFDDMKKDPFEGIGKPEQLKHNLSGKWSRRIDGEHRVIYAVDGDVINIYSLRGHYK